MTANEAIKMLPTKWRHDASVLVLGVVCAWGASILYGRLEAAEAKANTVASVQADVIDVKQKQAVMDQRLADTDANVKLLVGALLGQGAVISHANPTPNNNPAKTGRHEP